MKSITKLMMVAVLAIAAVAPVQAQFRWGIKAGVAVNSLKFNEKVVATDNRAGFTGGIVTEFTVPVVNIGFDASVLYANRSVEFETPGTNAIEKYKRHYIDVPVNFKYKIGLPLIGKVFTPYLTTGPDFSFLVSKSNLGDAVKNRKFDCAWTVGAGIQFVNHLQIGATYGFGMTKSASEKSALYSGKNRCWTITAAWLF